MHTVAKSQAPSKAFRATLRDEAGVLTKIDGEILFFNDVTGDMVTIEPDDCVWLCVLGEMGVADTQQLLDRLHGGYAQICCSRAQEVL